MPKPVHFVIALVCAVIAVAIASLVLNVLVFVHVMKDDHSKHDKDPVKLPLSQDHELPIVYEQDASLPEVPTALVETAPDPEISRALASVELEPPGSVLLSLAREPLHVNDSKYCPSYGESLNTPAWKEAASILLTNIDQNVDPCDDFYTFACGSYISHAKQGKSRAREAQKNVNTAIRKALDNIKVTDETHSATERITKAAFESCMTYERNHVEDILIDIANWFGAIPFLNQTLDDNYDVQEIIATAANLERMRALGTLMNSWVTVDYNDTSQNVLYFSQPSLPMPRDYYVLPQFTKMLEFRATMIQNLLIAFASLVLDDPTPFYDGIVKAAQEVAQFERDIAMASWPDTEMRDYSLQYNTFTLHQLETIYPEVGFQTYIENLLSGLDRDASWIAIRKIILSQPSYFGWLNGILNDLDRTLKFEMKTKIVNYMITQILFEEAEFLGPKMRAIVEEANYVPHVQRRGLGVRRIGRQLSRRFDSDEKHCPCRCIEFIMSLMPYGPGYVYAKSLPNREEIAKDAGEQVKLIIENFLEMVLKLDWMTTRSKMAVANKVRQIHINIGWPTELFGDFMNTTLIDDYHKEDYGPILEAYMEDSTDFFTIKHLLEEAFMNREAYRLLLQKADRTNFLASPAMINAWYQPERNSLTIPCALWIPPFYNKDYPKAFNFAAHGGVVGHELVHGFDDEGVQFDEKGALACNKRSWNQCTWLDSKSKKGFTDMAQCVVTQYSTQCCPEKKGYVHCVNGATTQGENIADLGGEQATYRAYLEYMGQQNTVEKRLPGLEQYTPNQLFWMFYANTWCANTPEYGLVFQLLADVHSPGSCRTNQVVQDIPAFGADFGCNMGQKMFPTPDIRCKVWVES